MSWALETSYAQLPERFFSRAAPVPAQAPSALLVNAPLAASLGLAPEDITAQIATGTDLPEGAEPISQAYAGHQFGQFVPQLGDGRAHLLGEQLAPDGTRHDIALKGSGRTAFSRGGDGRAALGPILREYVMSESLHALGLPTSRVLATAQTGEAVLRQEGPLPGAVLMRVAASHIRVGTFEYFAARADVSAVETLTAHACARHYPGASTPAEFLQAVMEAQAQLVAGWMSVGFIHGVMNTDNTAISGETIDYGPCAFMERFHPDQVFSSIDRQGRYAYANQPAAIHWNLAKLAGCLVLLEPDEELAIAEYTRIINRFPELIEEALQEAYRRKLGLKTAQPALVAALLEAMAAAGVEYTTGFAELNHATWLPAGWLRDRDVLRDPEAVVKMPLMVPRLHQISQAISAAETGDYAPFLMLLEAARHPFDRPEDSALMAAAPVGHEITQTFCGT